MAKQCNHRFVRCFENFRCSECGKVFTPAQREKYEESIKKQTPPDKPPEDTPEKTPESNAESESEAEVNTDE